jgi:hypothetical protein
MFDKVPILKRWRVILGLIGAVFLFSLLYAKQYWDTSQRLEELRKKTRSLESADMEIVNRQVELKQLGDAIAAIQQSKVELKGHAALMSYIEEQAASRALRMVSLPKEMVLSQGGYGIAQIRFKLEGMFHDILDLLYQIEQRDRVGSIAYVNLGLEQVRGREESSQLLIAEIHLNRLLANENEHTVSHADEE